MGFFTACKGCDSIFPGCHSQCEKYKREKAEYDRLMDTERQRKSTRQGLICQRSAAVKKADGYWKDWR